jgi:hypothetical protein
MSETNTQFGDRWQPLSFRFIGITVLSSFFSIALRDAGLLPYVVTYASVFSIALIIDYWIPPRPAFSFGFMITRILAFFFLSIFGLWLVPKLLVRWLWSPFAHGLSVWISTMLIFYVRPIARAQTKFPLWKRFVISTIAAIVFGLLGYFAHL